MKPIETALPPVARRIALGLGAAALLVVAVSLWGLMRGGDPAPSPIRKPTAANARPAAPAQPGASPRPRLQPVGENGHVLSALAAGNAARAHGHDGNAEDMRVKRILDIPGPMKYGDYVWDEADVPAGPLIVTIDLAAQTMSVFRDGYEIGASAIIYGADNKPTPLGVFPITQKDADHVSNIYDAPMPYMLRLTNDGVSIHGAEVAWGNATNGCIGVPLKFAEKLFGAAKLGDRVIITNGKMMNVAGATRG